MARTRTMKQHRWAAQDPRAGLGGDRTCKRCGLREVRRAGPRGGRQIAGYIESGTTREVPAKDMPGCIRPDVPAMTVSEAGRKGGRASAKKHGRAFYQEIGRKGGRKVQRLIAAGRDALAAGWDPKSRKGGL